MHTINTADAKSAYLSDLPNFYPVKPAARSSYLPSVRERHVIADARNVQFDTNARVAGYLLQADVGPVTHGYLFSADLPPAQNFVHLKAMGIDHQKGFDLVRCAPGVAYVIVSYANHARERGLRLLKYHIGANPDYYANLARVLSSPWQEFQTMVDDLVCESENGRLERSKLWPFPTKKS